MAITFACGLAQDILKCYAKDRYIKVEAKAKKGEGMGKRKKDSASKEAVAWAGIKEIKYAGLQHLNDLSTFQAKLLRTFELLQLKHTRKHSISTWADKSGPETQKSTKPTKGTLLFANKKDVSPKELAQLCASYAAPEQA
ncbi:hypothetical protein FRC07_002489 [Ceratobasidium sp. 392]|nr:hypothetical protein FRC07_002489 [Ceratobasidium sp. 392]